MKDTYYFPHDYNARNDQKIKMLIEKYQMVGYGIFWALVEELYNNDNKLLLNYQILAYDLRSEPDIIEAVINDFGLFKVRNNHFSSISVGRRLLERQGKSDKAKASAYYRWSQSERNANAIRPHTDRNAIKERKEIKEKKETNDSNFDFENSTMVYTPKNLITVESLMVDSQKPVTKNNSHEK